MRPQYVLGTIAALVATCAEAKVKKIEDNSVDAAISAVFELCPAIVTRGDGSVTKGETEKFRLSTPVDGGDRTVWALGKTEQPIVVAWIPLRQECSVMHSGSEKDDYFLGVQSDLTNVRGYAQTSSIETDGYITKAFSRQGSSDSDATHVVVVKTKDGRWVNAWFGIGKI